jgi:AraC-like DNA-binding protein
VYSSRIVDSTDPDSYVASIRPFATDFTVTERGKFWARSILFDLGSVYAQRGHETLTRVKHSDVPRSGIMFLTEPGPSMFFNGAEIGINQIAVAAAGESYICRLSGATRWGAMSLAKEDMDALCSTGAGNMSPMNGATVITPPQEALAHLRSLHNDIGRLAESAPDALTDAELAHDLELNLMTALRDTLCTHTVRPPDSLGRRNHEMVVKRFRELVHAQSTRPLHMSEINRKLGISGRTVRTACQEVLGVSPSQYIMLRRLHAARRALQNADPDLTRVTDIATEHGFWELGRFSVNYRHIFGESPSTTLKASR